MLWHGKNFRGFLNKASQVLFNKTGTTLQSDNVQDAISEIDGNLTPNPVTISYTWTSWVANGGLAPTDILGSVDKTNNIVNMNLQFIGFRMPSTADIYQIATLPVGSRPKTNIRYPIHFESISTKPVVLMINTSGAVTVTFSADTQSVSDILDINLSYLCA